MAQSYDNAAKYMMVEHSQAFAEFIVGHSNITVLEKLQTEEPTLKSHQNDSTLKGQLGVTKRREKGILLLAMQFNTEAVEPLKPALESIDDLQDLRQLLLTAPQSESLEAFMQSLRR